MVRGDHPPAAGVDASRTPDQPPADEGLSAPYRRAESPARRRHRDEPASRRHRGATRRRAAARPHPRAAPRHPGAAQGQHRHRRPHGDDRRLVRARGQPRAARRALVAAPAQRRRDHPRQGQPVGVGELPRLRPATRRSQRLERARRLHPQSLRARLDPCGSSSGSAVAAAANLCAARGRHRDRRIDRLSGRQQPRRRFQADRRADLAGRASSPSRTARTPPGPWHAR